MMSTLTTEPPQIERHIGLYDRRKGWRLAIVIPPRFPRAGWQAQAWFGGPCIFSNLPDFSYTGFGETREAAIADLKARCAADPVWNTIAENFGD